MGDTDKNIRKEPYYSKESWYKNASYTSEDIKNLSSKEILSLPNEKSFKQLEYKWNYYNGVMHGLQEGWFPDGKQEYKFNYIRGLKHGLQERWYPTGHREYRYNYISSISEIQRHGLQEEWSINGQLERKVNYLNGIQHGLQEYYYGDGRLKYKDNYSCGELHGIQINNSNTSCYKNGVLHDIQINDTYYKYGKEITKEEYEQYVKSIEHGILNILCIGKNTLDLIIKRYII